MEEIDYNTKIQNFLAMTETGNEEVAIKYLESSDWDETKAVNDFFNKSMETPNSTNINLNIDDNNIVTSDNNRLNKGLINNPNNSIINNIKNNNELRIKTDKKENKLNIIKRYLLCPLRFLLDCCFEPREVRKSEERRIFKYLPNVKVDFMNFCGLLKQRIGIIIFYRGKNVPYLNDLIGQICRSTITVNILKKKFMIYPLLSNTEEGEKIQKIVSKQQLIFPAFVFCYNSSKYQTYVLTENNIINILESESINLMTFHSTLVKMSEKLNNINISKNEIDKIDKSFGPLLDAEILSQQNFDMEKLEKEAIKKEEELKKQKLIEEKTKKEEELKMMDIEKRAKEAKEKIVEEPTQDDPESSVICFRYPDGDKTKTRRFLKSHTIQNLYDYITSLGKEIYTENENNKFSLYQPFPPKKYDIMENTLEKEGLFPNAVIQIREE